MGGVRDARSAGTTEDRTVAPRPTTNAATIVRGRSCSVVFGRTTPNADSSARSPMARAKPAASPITDAINPTITASASTERRTCAPLAPSARNSPSSRVRCDTRIWNVLKMMNAPTNSAITANTSSAMLKNDNAFFRSLDCFAAVSAPVFAWNPVGRTCWIRDLSSSGVTPAWADTSIASNFPPPFSTVCAVTGSNATSVAPARLSAVPNLAMPTIVACIDGPWSSTVTWSPRWRSLASAVCRSTTISPDVRGGCPPGSRRSGLSWASFPHDTPKVGAPPVVMACPCLSTSCAYPLRVPIALRTPGTARIVPSRLVGTRWAEPASSLLRPCDWNLGTPVTSTATPFSTVENRLSKAFPMVSVRMNVPATNATPTTMENAVRARRTFLAISPLIVARHIPVSLRATSSGPARAPRSARASRRPPCRPRGTRPGPRSPPRSGRA